MSVSPTRPAHFASEIAALRQRLLAVESERASLRAVGAQEKYRDACARAAALEIDIEQLELSVRLMAQHGISYNGLHYQYRAHRHGDLASAVKHALAQHAPRATEVATPDQHQLMRTLGITLREGVYYSGGYSYDRLSDALAYSDLKAIP